jgi:XTP/dITP diphosphohydrolase
VTARQPRLPRLPQLVVATANPAKAREFRALLHGLGYEIRTLADHPGVQLPAEGATSYADNARAKARTAAGATGLVALGDDSGLEVDALGGRPGVASARYGGPGLDDAERVLRLLAELAGPATRTARFRSVLALVAPWGAEALVEGVVEGVLTEAPRGGGGFGYDPIFLVPGVGRTFGELTDEEKHRLSHRGRAVARARPILQAWATEAGGRERSG